MIRRTKRSWSTMDTQDALQVISEARRQIASLMARAPINSDEYRALSGLMADLGRAALAFGHDVTMPSPARSLSKP